MTETYTIEKIEAERFSRLYKLYKERVYQYAFLLTQSRFHAEDIVQEVFLKLWINRRQLDHIENFNAWLYTMARNKTLDRFRAISRERSGLKELQLQTNCCSCTTEEMIDKKENKKLLRLAVDSLSPQRKMIYQMIRISGWKREKVARALDISPNTVKCQMTTALKQIKEYLEVELCYSLSLKY